MKRLFDKNSQWNKTSRPVMARVDKTIRRLVIDLVDQGFCPRDISYAIMSSAHSQGLMAAIGKNPIPGGNPMD